MRCPIVKISPNLVALVSGIMNTYCWIHGTFTIPSQIAGQVGSQVAHPGVAPLNNPGPTLDPNDPYLVSNLLSLFLEIFLKTG
jgi:hypothetical protein